MYCMKYIINSKYIIFDLKKHCLIVTERVPTVKSKNMFLKQMSFLQKPCTSKYSYLIVVLSIKFVETCILFPYK